MAENEIRNPAKAYFKWKMPVIAKSEDDWNFWNTEDKYNRTMFIGYNDTTTPHVASLFLIVDGKAIPAVGDDVLARIAQMEVDISTQMAEIQQLITQANEQQQSINTLRTEVQLVLQNCSAFADEAEIWAEGSDEDVASYGGEHSAKGWALRAGEIISTGLPSEASFDKLSVTGAIPSNDMSTRVPNTEWVQNAIQAGGGGVSPDSDITCKSITATTGGANLVASYSAERAETASIKVIPATQGTASSITLDVRTSNWEYPAQISMTNTFMQTKVPGRMEITVGDTDSSPVDLSIGTQSYVSTPWTHQLSCMLPIRANNGLYVKNRSTNESAFIATNTLDDDAATNPKLTISGTLSVYGERTNTSGSKSSVTMLAHRAASDTDGSYVMLKAENSGSGSQSYLDVQEGETQIGTPKLTYFDKGDKTSSTEAIRIGKASEQAYSTQRYIYSELIGRFVNGLQIGLINDYEPDGVPFKILRSDTSTSGKWLAAFGVTPTVPDITDAADSSDKVPNTKWVQAAIAAGGGGGGSGAVSSVNGKTGAVVLSGEDIRLHPTVGDYTYPAVSDVIDSISNYLPDGVSGDNKLVDNSSLSTRLATYQPKLTAGEGITISPENVISATGGSGGGAVTSVNGNTGAVVLTGDNIMTASDSTTSLNSALAGKQASITAETDLTCKSVTTSYDSALNSINYAGNISFTGDSGNGSLGKITANELFTNISGYYGTRIQASGIKCTSGAGGTTWFNLNSSDKTVSVDGTITATSPAADANNNQVATTSWVKSELQSNLLNYTTNRILEIPQDIKLELNNGTLTLKAGSKVYVPNGFEADGTTPKFDEVVISSDLTNTTTANDKIALTVYTNKLAPFLLSSCFSGGSAPTSPSAGTLWYDTVNNKMKVYANSDWYERNDCLPIALLTAKGSSYVSIDQVLNGFGYIGSTVFALPGVKVQIPNGRNADGTCRSIITTVDSVKTLTVNANWGTYDIFITHVGGIARWPDIVSGSAGTRYNAATNHYEVIGDGKWNTQLGCVFVKIKTDTTSPYRITSFEPYTVDAVANSNASNFSQVGRSLLSGLGMPSGRYIDLTLAASGSTYTAPANGWFFFVFTCGNTGGYVNAYIYRGLGFMDDVAANGAKKFYLPALKGDTMRFAYPSANTSSSDWYFQFIYAEGEEN